MLDIATSAANANTPLPGLKPRAATASYQRSIQTTVTCRGVALHSGQDVSMRLCPAPAGHGIVFVRTDLPAGENIIPASYNNVRNTALCTQIVNGAGHSVSTIEHLMAAAAGMEIDNLLIEIDGGEVPVMDGSAAPFVFLLECAGIVAQDEPRAYIEILKPVMVSEQNGHGPKSAALLPGAGFRVDCEIDFTSPAIGRQHFNALVTPTSFKNEIARARTFGFLEEVEQMRAAGLGLGGKLENSVVIDGDKVMNSEGLRFADEFARHKALDCIGDLYLAGYPILGIAQTYRSGHAMNNQLLRALFADSSAWRLVKPAETRAAAA